MSNKSVIKPNIVNGLSWKLLERFGVLGVQFILQIILARLLEPEHYGMLSMMIIFTTLANVFVQGGFNTALVQNKDVEEEDYSSVFWVSLLIAILLYLLLFWGTPIIANFYSMPDMITPFRVLALMLLPGAMNSVQIARVSRNMDFKKVFVSNIASILISGIIGIILAYKGAGVWALVVQTMLNVVVSCIVMGITVKWCPQLRCNLKRVRKLFAYSWKLLVANLIETLYTDLRSLIIGKRYDSGSLGYYNRGKQFPQFFINAINGAVQSVLLPAMSTEQDDKKSIKNMMRNSIMLSAYIIFPMMAGLAAVAPSLVSILLTDKWLPCVPYLQLYCFTFAFYPVHTCNLQAINAMGRSDVFLKLEILKKGYGILALVVAVFYFDSPIAIAGTGLVTTWIGWFVNAYPNKKLVNYSYIEQCKDLLPSLIMTVIMGGIVYVIGLMKFNLVVTLILQITLGIIIYVILSVIIKPSPYKLLVNKLKNV